MDERAIIELLERKKREVGGQNELARRIGIDPGQFSRVMKGKIHPGPRVLRYLGLTKAYTLKRP